VQSCVNDYREIRQRAGTHGTYLSSEEIKDYINGEVMEKLLSHQLSSVNLPVLKRSGGFEVLEEFVKEMFQISWGGRDLEGVKSLDVITRNLIIPSRSGSNIVNSLIVSYFCYF
jgi:hypothetical protein